jgi:hypothetical protein
MLVKRPTLSGITRLGVEPDGLGNSGSAGGARQVEQILSKDEELIAALSAQLQDLAAISAPFVMKASTPGLVADETVELTPFLILDPNHAYTINIAAAAVGVDSVAGRGAEAFSITTAIAIKDGTTLNPGTNTSNSNPASPGIPWSLTLGVGANPDRLSLIFETNTVGSVAACNVVAFVSLVPVPF